MKNKIFGVLLVAIILFVCLVSSEHMSDKKKGHVNNILTCPDKKRAFEEDTKKTADIIKEHMDNIEKWFEELNELVKITYLKLQQLKKEQYNNKYWYQ